MSAIPYRRQGFTASAIRTWVRFYTLGLPEEQRERRLFQIESDLWEHWQDRAETQAPPLLLTWETTDRALRGMAADILWRLQLEGPKVNIHIPIERLAGAFVLLLIVGMVLSTSAAGYDASADGFETELERLASVKSWQADVYTFFQTISGLGMLLAGAVFFTQLRDRAHAAAAVSAFLLTGAGVLALATSAIYFSAADLADEWIASGRSENELNTARAMTLLLTGLSVPLLVTLASAVYTLAFSTSRHRLVAHPLGWLAVASGGFFLAAAVAELAGTDAGWILMSGALLLMVVWMVSTGFQLLLGGRATISPGSSPQPGQQPV
ncbi:MAG: hypothetical protein AB7T37_02650 [Dehalococcoidia bacterium]